MLTAGNELTTIVVVAGSVQRPEVGVNVYDVVCKLFGNGAHVPVIPSMDVVGSVGKTPPEQIAGIVEKLGVIFGLTTRTPFTLVVPFQKPPPVEL